MVKAYKSRGERKRYAAAMRNVKPRDPSPETLAQNGIFQRTFLAIQKRWARTQSKHLQHNRQQQEQSWQRKSDQRRQKARQAVREKEAAREEEQKRAAEMEEQRKRVEEEKAVDVEEQRKCVVDEETMRVAERVTQEVDNLQQDMNDCIAKIEEEVMDRVNLRLESPLDTVEKVDLERVESVDTISDAKIDNVGEDINGLSGRETLLEGTSISDDISLSEVDENYFTESERELTPEMTESKTHLLTPVANTVLANVDSNNAFSNSLCISNMINVVNNKNKSSNDSRGKENRPFSLDGV